MHTHTYIYVVYFITYKHIYICLIVNISYIHMKWSRNISSNITWRSFSGRLERGGRCWSRGCCYAVGTDVNHAVTLHTKKVVYITGKCVHMYIYIYRCHDIRIDYVYHRIFVFVFGSSPSFRTSGLVKLFWKWKNLGISPRVCLLQGMVIVLHQESCSLCIRESAHVF